MVPDRADIYAMCSLCGVCVFNNGEIRGDANDVNKEQGENCGLATANEGCIFYSQSSLEQSRVYAFRINSGEVVVVDLEDKSKILGYSWRKHERSGHICAVIDGRTVQIHRHILNVTDPDILVDHIFHEKRDNRKSQLRKATHAQNRQNTRKRGNSSSPYLGVYYDSKRKVYAASIQYKENGKRTNRHLGYYDDEWQAAEAFNRAATEAYGEFAILNKKSDIPTGVGGVHSQSSTGETGAND